MKGTFFAGLALGALLGAILLDTSPETKKLAEDGKNAIKKSLKKN